MEALKQIHLDRKIHFALNEFQKEILPADISDNGAATWVLKYAEFETLQEKPNQNREIPNDENPKAEFIAQLSSEIVSNNITFYYASLIHIGRVWKVSAMTVTDIKNSLEFENLEETIELNFTQLSKSLTSEGLDEVQLKKSLRSTIITILRKAESAHLANIEKAKAWWQIWREEVIELQEKQNRVKNTYNDSDFGALLPLLNFSYSSKGLFKELKKTGLSFHNLPTPTFSTLNINLLSQLILSDRYDLFHVRDILHKLIEIFKEQQTTLFEQRIAPTIKQAEEKLRIQFKNDNPFEKYRLLQSVPDDELTYLWKICTLPNDEMFYIAQQWYDLLEDYIDTSRELRFKAQPTKEDILQYTKSADSALKRHWVTDWNYKDSLMTNNEWLQLIFEKEWITNLFLAATSVKRSKKSELKWDIKSLSSLVQSVADRLNAIGYTLEVPGINRLQVLWEESQKNWWVSEW